MSLALHVRLRKHADYQRVYKAGRKQFGKQISYFCAAQPLDGVLPAARVGLTVPKALGKAVDRNRIKRRMRAAVRGNLALLTAPIDVILHPRRSVLTCEYGTLVREVGVVLRSVQSMADRGLASAALQTPRSGAYASKATPAPGVKASQKPARTPQRAAGR